MRKLKLQELQRPSLAQYRQVRKHPVVIVLDNIRSGMNVGSFFRTADAFACERILLCGITPCPPHKEITKTAIGATNSVEWMYVEDIVEALEQLKDQGYEVIGIEQTDSSISLHQVGWNRAPKALVFGNEVEGISESIFPLVDACIEIPQWGTKHSLNVSVCGGIILWQAIQPYKLYE